VTESSTALRKNTGVIAPHGGALVSRIVMGDEAAIRRGPHIDLD